MEAIIKGTFKLNKFVDTEVNNKADWNDLLDSINKYYSGIIFL